MDKLLQVKELVRVLYSKFEVYITPVLKFLVAFISFSIINGELGFMPQLNNIAIVLIASLLCSFLPLNILVLLEGVFVVAHVYKLSLECAAVMLILFMVVFLVYFRFAPKDAAVMLLMPIANAMGIPIVVPVCAGLLSKPTSCVSVACGTAAHFMVSYVSQNKDALETLADDGALEKLRFLADGLLNNKGMIISAIAFGIVVVVVYLIRRLPIKFAWLYGMGAGVVVNLVIQLVGAAKFETGANIALILLSSVVAVLVGLVLMFFVFNVNFEQTENVQFEDDDYYYYVKAVPKRKSTLGEQLAQEKINLPRRPVGAATDRGQSERNQAPAKKTFGIGGNKSAAKTSAGTQRTGAARTRNTGMQQPGGGPVRNTGMQQPGGSPVRNAGMQQPGGTPMRNAGMQQPGRNPVRSAGAPQPGVPQSGMQRVQQASASQINRVDRPIKARTPSTAAREEAKRAAQAKAQAQAQAQQVSNQFTSSIEGLETFSLKDE